MAVLLGLVAGLGLLAFVFLSFGVPTLAAAVVAAPLPLLVAVVWRLVTLILLALSWRRVLPPGARPPRRLLLRFRWIGEAVNALLPVAQVGGDLARARLLTAAGVARSSALAALIADMALGTASQVAFVVLALAAVAHERRALTLALPAAAGLALAVAGTAALALLMKVGTRRLLRAFRIGTLAGEPIARAEEGLEAPLAEIRSRRWDLVLSFAGHLLAWLSQVVETWVVLAMVGAHVSWRAASALEALSTVARGAAFVIPGGYGVQEGALVLEGRHLGVATGAVLTLGIVKRLRELVLGAPAIALWIAAERRLLGRLARKLPRRRPAAEPSSEGDGDGDGGGGRP